MKSLAKYNKFIVAIIGAIFTVVVQHYGTNEVVQAIIPVLAALGVYAAPNAQG